MSHIFISYAHDDQKYLDRLVTWLTDSHLIEREVWYDKHIEGGNNWRDEIATALDEAFAVVVIVTTNSINSLFCTYEWAYAMGQGIPLFPLLFENVPITDIPTPLTTKQFTNCIDEIEPYLKDQLRRLKTTAPQIAILNRTVYEAIVDTHRRFFILGWIGDYINRLDHEFRVDLIAYFVRKATEAHTTLQTLMLDKSFVFSGRQYRYCWQLIDFLQEFMGMHRKIDNYLQLRLFARFDNEWLPAFEHFEGDGWWSSWVRKYFERDLENENNRMQVFAEMMRVFPTFLVDDATILIDSKAYQQKQARDSDNESET